MDIIIFKQVKKDIKHICPDCGKITINKSPSNFICECGYSPLKGVKKKEKIHICPDCGKEIINKGAFFICECGYKYFPKYNHICGNPKCNYQEETNHTIWTCPKCFWSNFKPNIYEHKCSNPNCGYYEENKCPINTWVCPKCHSGGQKYHHICDNPECRYEENNKCPENRWICPKCGHKNKVQVCHHEYPNCHTKEDSLSTAWTCPNCHWSNRKYKHYCPNCKKYFNNSTPNNMWICECGYIPENSIRSDLYLIKFCEKCQCKTPHDKNNLDKCFICSGEYIYCNIHKRFESYEFYKNEIVPKKIIYNYCKCCNNETPHKYSQNTRKLECQVCNGNLVYNFYVNTFVTLENFESIEENKNQERYYMHILENKGIKSKIRNVRKYKSLAKRNGLSFESFINSLVWCPHCERWETPSFNSKSNHWMFWEAETRQWMSDNPDKVNLAKKIIKGLDILLNSSTITGVYGWFINDQISYVGESMDILTRSWNHIMYIFEEPDYWYDVINYMDKNKIEVRVLKSVNKNDPKYINFSSKEFKSQVLKPLELDFISKLYPDSQKCDGTDHIRPINQRQIKINK